MRALKALAPAAIVVIAICSTYVAVDHAMARAFTSSPTQQPVDEQILAAVQSLSAQVNAQASKINALQTQVGALQKQLASGAKADKVQQLHEQVGTMQRELDGDVKQISGRLYVTCVSAIEADISASTHPGVPLAPDTTGVPTSGYPNQIADACTKSEAWHGLYVGNYVFAPFN